MELLSERLSHKLQEGLDKGYYIYLYFSSSKQEYWFDLIDVRPVGGKEEYEKKNSVKLYDNIKEADDARFILNYKHNLILRSSTEKIIKRLEKTSASFSLGLDFKRLNEDWSKFISEHPDAERFFNEFFAFRDAAKKFEEVLKNLTGYDNPADIEQSYYS